MKSNLDSLFKNNKEMEESGIWFEVGNGAAFKIKRFGGWNSTPIKAALAKHYKPYAKLIEANSLSLEKEREINMKVFVHACVEDWRGIEIEGKQAEFSKDACVKLFCDLPELADVLVQCSTDSKNYREELGNS